MGQGLIAVEFSLQFTFFSLLNCLSSSCTSMENTPILNFSHTTSPRSRRTESLLTIAENVKLVIRTRFNRSFAQSGLHHFHFGEIFMLEN